MGPPTNPVRFSLLHEVFCANAAYREDQWQRRSKPYRTRVLSYLGDEEPIGVQQPTPSQLDRRLRDVAPEELIRRPALETWSIAEIVAHLADAELAMGWRLRNMLANPGVALTWWDEAAWAERLGYAQQAASLFGRGLSGAAREQPATVGVGPARTVGGVLWVHEVRGRQTIEEFVGLEAGHDLNHLRQIWVPVSSVAVGLPIPRAAS
jgi:DinB superfamily